MSSIPSDRQDSVSTSLKSVLMRYDHVSKKEAATRIESVSDSLPSKESPSEDPRTSDVASSRAQQQHEVLLKTAYRKMDVRLLVIYCLIELFMKLSARNITNVAIINLEQGTGIKQQLGNLTSAQWAWVLSIFYYPYMVFEPFSTIAVKWCRPNRWMSRIMISWGIIAMCQSAAHSHGGLLACRFLLGLAEAGLWPAIMFHISFWYPADRLPLRIALLSACGQCSGTFSGLLAFAIAYLNGAAGLSGWRWVFILEGIPALILGIACLFCLPNYPEPAFFLSAQERQAVLDAMPKNQPTAGSKTWDSEQVKATLKDPVFYTFLLIWTCLAIGGWGVTVAFPSVIYALRLQGTSISQLMTMPPYAIGSVVLLLVAHLIRKKKVKAFPCAIALEIGCCACYVLLVVVRHAIVKYVFVCLTLVCCTAILPILWPERIRAAQGTTSTGLAIGVTSSLAHLAGIVGPQLYQSRFGPTYQVSFVTSIGLLAVCILATVASWAMLKRREVVHARRQSEESIQGRGASIAMCAEA